MVWGCHLLEITHEVWNFLRFSHETMKEARCQKMMVTHPEPDTLWFFSACYEETTERVAVPNPRWLLNSQANFRSYGNKVWDLDSIKWHCSSISPSRRKSVFPHKSLFYLLHCHLSSILRYTTGLNSERRTTVLVRIRGLVWYFEHCSE